MRRLLLLIAIFIVLTAIVAPAVMIWAGLYTNSGLQFIVRHIPQQLGDVRLVITGVHGTVADGLQIDRVEIEHPIVHVTVTGIEGRVALAPLALQTIRAIHGTVQSAVIQVKRRTHPVTPGPPQFLPRWLLINVEDAALSRVTIIAYNGYQLHASELRAAAVIRHEYIRFFQAEGSLEDFHIRAMGKLLAADPLGMEVQGRLNWNPTGQPPWTVELNSANGDLDHLSIHAHAVSPFRAEITGQLLGLTSRWHWAADAIVQDFDLHAWGMNTPLGHITGHVSGSGNEHGFTGHGPVNPTGLKAGEFEAQFSGSYSDHTLTARQIEVHHLASGARASGSGTIGIVEHGPRLDLRGEVVDFRWPLAGRNPAVRGVTGTFTLAGVLPYTVHVSGRGRAAELPEMTVDASGTLGKDGVTFDPAVAGLFGGRADVSGRVDWSPGESWSLNGHAAGINPGALRPDLPGNLSFAFNASGRGFDPRGEVTASFSQLSGKLRGSAAHGSGTITHSGTTWAFNRVRVGLGTASLALDGELGQRINVRFDLTASDLSLVAPDARGKIKASGAVTGSRGEAPMIVATAHGGDFEYQGLKLESVDADVNFNPSAPWQSTKIDARLHNLTHGKRTLDSVVLTVDGPASAWDVHLAAAAKGLAIKAQASGPYAQRTFKGRLGALTINGSEALHLTLEHPVDFSVALDAVSLQWLCLVGTPGSICADGHWSSADWDATLSASQLPLATLTAGTTPAVDYAGTIDVHAQIAGGGNKPATGMLQAQLANAEIVHRLVSHKMEHTRIGSGTVTVTATPTSITARADIGNGGVGNLHGVVDLTRESQRWQDWPLTGELHARCDDASLVTLYVPDIDRASGHVVADAQLAGTAGEPRFTGQLQVDDGEIDVFRINLSLRQVALLAKLNDSGVEFRGSAHAGKGLVNADGHVEWRNLQPYGKLHLEGSNLRVADLPEAQIDASPDLDFNIQGRRIEVTGRVLIPFAKIQPKDLTGAVSVSPDEVIVGQEPEDASRRLEVMSTITLVLGDRVNVDAMGLTARLVGSVTIVNGSDTITHGSGELSVAEGRYSAYARQLDIQRGRLIFAGGPITDPGIDVVAQKQFPDVTAGINVRGTLRQPRISFFSDPPLTQSQIASLILSGGSLDAAQNASNAALGQAAALAAAQLGPRVGITDVSLETDPILNETSLVLGRYLSPRLYISYGVSLTEQLNTFKMRYTLGDHWTIRTEAGQAYGIDLVYSITR
jgi:translocation and assembly module TamB